MVGGRAGGVLLAALSVVVTTNLLGTEEYGRLNYLLVLSLIVATAALWTQASVLTIGREEFDRDGKVGTSTWARAVVAVPLLTMTCLVIVGGWLGGLWYGAYPAEDIGLVLAAAVVFILNEHLLVVLQVRGLMKRSAVMLLAQRALLLTPLAVLLVTGGDADVTTVLLLTTTSYTISTLWLISATGRTAFSPLRVEPAAVSRLTRLSLPLLAASLSYVVVRWSDILVIEFYRTFTEVGQYALAFQGYHTFYELNVPLLAVLVPLIVSLKGAGRVDVVGRFYSRSVAHGALLSGTVLALVAVPIHLLIPTVFGSGFEPAADPFVVLLLSLQLGMVSALLTSIFLGLGTTRPIGVASILIAAVTLGANFLLVPSIGIIGASIATTAGQMVGAVTLTIYARRLVDTSPPSWWLGLLPMMAGITPLLAIEGWYAYLMGPAAAVISLAMVLRWSNIVIAEDSEIVSQLRAPPTLVRLFDVIIRVSRRQSLPT